MAWQQIVRDTAANFTAKNEILLENVVGFETDTNKSKTGDAVTTWTSLPYNNPNAGTFTGLITAQAGLTVTTAPITAPASTTTVANLNTPAGVLKTTPIAGDHDYDGAASYITNDVTGGRGFIPVTQYRRLTAAGSTISTIANYFGATSNISLVASAFYEIDIYAFFLNTTSGTVVWTLTNSAQPTLQNIMYEMSPVTGIVAIPGTATMLSGQAVGDTTATLALPATGALTTAVNHYMHMKIWLQNGAGTSLKIQATKSAGTITPGVGSYYKVTRLPAANTGNGAA
jgi:hypothetical protein